MSVAPTIFTSPVHVAMLCLRTFVAQFAKLIRTVNEMSKYFIEFYCNHTYDK